MSETDFEGPPGTLSHPEGEPVDPVDPDAPEVDAEPGDAVSLQDGDGEPVDPDVDPDADEQARAAAALAAVQSAGMSPEALEAAAKKIDQSANRHRARVEELLGPENFAALVPCELCSGDILGFHWPPELLVPESELDARLIDALRAGNAPPFNEAPDRHVCETCGGYGAVLTGSKVPGRTRIKCSTCRGGGFVPPLGDGAPGAGPTEADLEPGGPGEAQNAADNVDAFGSPKYLEDGQENPNWGRMPQYKNPDLP